MIIVIVIINSVGFLQNVFSEQSMPDAIVLSADSASDVELARILQ